MLQLLQLWRLAAQNRLWQAVASDMKSLLFLFTFRIFKDISLEMVHWKEQLFYTKREILINQILLFAKEIEIK